MQFGRTFTGAPWEQTIGYCRALKAGRHIYVSGTAPVDDQGGVFAPGDAYAQTTRCYQIIEQALRKLGSNSTSIVRSRMYVTDITRAEEFGRAHKAFFGTNYPCLSMVGVSALISPEMLVEVEAEAVDVRDI